MENKSRLLMKEQPLVVDKELAKLIGLNEAIVLQQIEYWTNIKEISDIRKNKTRNENYVNGYYWTYNSVEEWTKEFPFWSYDTVKRTLKKLREKNLVVTDNFNLKGYDRTLWYRVNHAELIALENAIGADCPNEENSDSADAKNSEALKTDIGAKCPNGLVQNDPMDKGKMPQPIPKTSSKISTKTSSCSSSNKKLIDIFSENICELKGISKSNFVVYCYEYDYEFITAIIEYCSKKNAKTYDYFETVIKFAIQNDTITAEEFLASVEAHKASKKSNKKTSSKKNYNKNNDNTGNCKKLRFNNFEARQYDYDSLEKKLLGWE